MSSFSSLLWSVQRNRLLALLGGVVALGVTVGLMVVGRSHAAVSPTMSGFVHEDDSIGLKFADGSSVGGQTAVPQQIPPGTYSISVLDDATEHNFHITGPGVDQSTDIGGMSTPTWSVTLLAGSTYRFQCDNHPDFMWGWFATTGTAAGGGSSSGGSGVGTGSSGSGGTSSGGSGSSGSSGGSTGGTTATSVAGTLSATITLNGGVTFTFKGNTVKTLKAGTYKISVLDGSKRKGFAIQQAKHPAVAITSAAFVGKHTATVKLARGTYAFTTPTGTKSFTVS